MSFVLAGIAVAGATGLTKTIVGSVQKNKAKKRQADAKIQMEKDKDAYMNAPILNQYDNMENTMEDLTVNTQAADFAAQKSEQARADIMQNMSGAAGSSGIAALAQTMANTANQEAQAASATIASQEAANQQAERQAAGSIQKLQAEGEANVENLKRDRMATQLGMSQAEYGAETQNVADAQAAMMSGIGDIGGAIGTGLGELGSKSPGPKTITTELGKQSQAGEWIDGKFVPFDNSGSTSSALTWPQ